MTPGPKTINIACDFSPYPGGRWRTDGDESGEAFRDDVLVPALREYERVVVELDGTLGYGSSFLEEAFGGLVRECGFTAGELASRLSLVGMDIKTVRTAWEYINEAGARKEKP